MKKLLIVLLTVCLLISFFGTAHAETLYVISGDKWFGAVNKYYFDLLVKCLEDIDAVQKLMDSGVVFWLREGAEVYLVKSEWGAVELRPKGEIATFWTYSEAIKKK